MNVLLEDWIGLDMLELSLEVLQTGSITAAVGSTTSIGKVEAFILDLFAVNTPVYDSQPCADSAGALSSVMTNHPPLPAPFFLVFFGSTSMWPDLAK